MSKVHNGEQNEHEKIYFEMFYGSQKLHKKHKYFRAVRNCTDTYIPVSYIRTFHVYVRNFFLMNGIYVDLFVYRRNSEQPEI